MSKLNFSAVIFDLDGVVTQTALVHSIAWKEMFDEFSRYREDKFGEPFIEFTHNNDYLPFVDGMPRYKGVHSYLLSREIDIPFGNPKDKPSFDTVCSLGNLKNQKFNEILNRDGVEVYDGTINLIKELKKQGIQIGLASSSKNCVNVIKTAEIEDLFETCIDGIVSAELGLKGKPEPDIFTTAADYLNCYYDQVVVVEDAVSGVKAGEKGNFGLVIGVARENNKNELRANGADITVSDLAELTINDINKWFEEGLPQDQWCLNYYDYIPEQEGVREAMCTIGNGYFGTRGSLEFAKSDENHYPGTYITGVNNRLSSKINGIIINNEDMVNCPNWLIIQIKIGANDWEQFNPEEIVEFHRQLVLKHGVLKHKILLCNKQGQQTLIETSRFVSMSDPHCAALKYNIIPINYSDTISVRSGITYATKNTGVKRYQQLANQHLKTIDKGCKNDICHVLVETTQSKIKIAQAINTKFFINGKKVESNNSLYDDDDSIYMETKIPIKKGQILSAGKLVSIFTSQDIEKEKPLTLAKNTVSCIDSFDQLKKNSDEAWDSIWEIADIKIEGDRLSQKLIRLNIYHLMITKSNHLKTLNWGIPARGLHGEAYRGHIFWDELFILPFYCYHFPEIVKSVLLYRYDRLGSAREYAQMNGFSGAMFPWQSGNDGVEETQTYHLNPMSSKWGKDNSVLQRHVSLAIAYNIWQYYWVSQDLSFLTQYGAEMFLEIARFWASVAGYNAQLDKFEIENVMGPDEFHEQYPNSDKEGLKNNSYTNIMVSWVIAKAIDILELLTEDVRQLIMNNLLLSEEEINHWAEIRKKIAIVSSDEQVLDQFEGYFDLIELDWKKYREKYKVINRMDRILKSEGKTPDKYKVSKQADALMSFYLLSQKELSNIFTDIGFPSNTNTLKNNFDYYYPRTSHGSTLSPIVHSTLASLIGYDQLSWDLFLRSLKSDYCDIQGGTTSEGIHTGVMGATLQHVIKIYAGVDLSDRIVRINPNLPNHWRTIHLNILFRNIRYYFIINSKKIMITCKSKNNNTIEIEVMNNLHILRSGKQQVILLV